MAAAPAGRVAVVAGATGLVGRRVVAALAADGDVAAVHCVGRRALEPASPADGAACKVHSHVLDFAALPDLAAEIGHVDDVYLCLGTTIKTAGSQEAFRAVDYDAVLACARAARQAGATRAGLVSSIGADAGSGTFYLRTKGEAEAAVAELGFDCFVIVRPSFLDGDRAALGQPARTGERVGIAVAKALSWIVPKNYRAISVDAVAAGLVKRVKLGVPGKTIVLSGELQADAPPK